MPFTDKNDKDLRGRRESPPFFFACLSVCGQFGEHSWPAQQFAMAACRIFAMVLVGKNVFIA